MRGIAREAPRRFAAIGVAVMMVCAVITLDQHRVVADNSTPDLTGRIALGDAHTCAIHEVETVWCWGSNSDGQLGLGGGSSLGTFVTPQQLPVFGDAPPVQLVAGKSHTCGLLEDGTTWCWGSNGFGAVSGTGVVVRSPRKVVFTATVPDLAVTKLFAGGDNTCALMADASVMCWGVNSYGQLGSGPADDNAHSTPTRVTNTDTTLQLQSLAIGTSHICARATDNRIWCWGANSDHQSSDSNDSFITSPQAKVDNGAFGADIAVGSEHTCTMQIYVGQNNAAICFGLNTSMQAPATMVLSSPIEAVYAGGNFSCARLRDGAPQCWGSNSDSQLGTGTASTASRGTANVVTGLDDSVVDLSLGRTHACAVMADGELNCWGSNDSGQLGNSDSSDHHTATAVPFINIAPVIPEVPDVVDNVESPQPQPVINNAQGELLVVDTKVSEVLPQVTATPAVKPRISRLKITRGQSVSSKRLSRAVSLAIPKKSQGKMRISIVKGTKNCQFVGTSIRTVLKGTCTVSVTLLPKSGEKVTRKLVISVR